MTRSGQTGANRGGAAIRLYVDGRLVAEGAGVDYAGAARAAVEATDAALAALKAEALAAQAAAHPADGRAGPTTAELGGDDLTPADYYAEYADERGA